MARLFAAKEAILNASLTGISAPPGWQDMEVGREEGGEPFVILHGGGQTLLQARGAQHVLISLDVNERSIPVLPVAPSQGAGKPI